MTPLRVLLVTETYPPEINGVAMTSARLVEGLRRRGHWVGVVRPRQRGERERGVDADTWTVPGLPIPNYPGLRLGLPAWRRLGQLLDSQRPHRVHVVTEGPLGWAALRAARARNLPVTSGYHTHFDQFSPHYGLRWLTPWISGWIDGLHRRCQATLAPTPELAATLAARGIPGTHVLGRGVDIRLFRPERRDPELRRQWGVAENAPACLYVGRMAPEKNLALVEAAFARIAERHTDARMIWVGDGPSLAGLRRRHPAHIFAGPRLGEDLARHYASADLFLFASLTETWGNVLGEALASGLAVVSYRRAAGEHLIVEDVNGLAVGVGDAEAFIAAAYRAATEPALRARLGAAASLSMRAHGWDAIVERFEQVLRATLAAAPDPSV
ncbi:MAG: glycosyltransferase family 1 protein [Betaproteobacteria bacterium]|nr:glycosyltransferase family 1 protein [Betaproteobacteria bacterium]